MHDDMIRAQAVEIERLREDLDRVAALVAELRDDAVRLRRIAPNTAFEKTAIARRIAAILTEHGGES